VERCRAQYPDQSEEKLRRLLDSLGCRNANFETLKKKICLLSQDLDVPSPGRDQLRRKDIFVGWVNSHWEKFEPFISQLTTDPIQPELPRSEDHAASHEQTVPAYETAEPWEEDDVSFYDNRDSWEESYDPFH
jgi:hypothetical protein